MHKARMDKAEGGEGQGEAGRNGAGFVLRGQVSTGRDTLRRLPGPYAFGADRADYGVRRRAGSRQMHRHVVNFLS